MCFKFNLFKCKKREKKTSTATSSSISITTISRPITNQATEDNATSGSTISITTDGADEESMSNSV